MTQGSLFLVLLFTGLEATIENWKKKEPGQNNPEKVKMRGH